MDLWRRAREPVEERAVPVGGLIFSFALSTALFVRDHWKGAIFIGLWGPALFQMADRLREAILHRHGRI